MAQGYAAGTPALPFKKKASAGKILYWCLGNQPLPYDSIEYNYDVLSGTNFKTSIGRIREQIQQGVYLDHGVGMSDLPYNLEEDVTVNEGTVIDCHSELPNGNISFKPLNLEKGSSVLWSGYLVVEPPFPAHSLSRPFDSQTLDEDGEYNNALS